jgi:hypothetical protein
MTGSPPSLLVLVLLVVAAACHYAWLERLHVPHRKDTGGRVALPIPFPVIDAYVSIAMAG